MDRYLAFLADHIDEKRLIHSKGTAKQAVILAKLHGADEEKAYIAGMLHDVAKGKCEHGLISLARQYSIFADEYELLNPELIHGKLGARMVRDHLGIVDEDILNAICWHTTGRANMSLLEKIIYIADLTEPTREFENINLIRESAMKDIDLAMIIALKSVIEFVQSNGYELHPNSREAHEYFIKEEKKKLGL